MSENEGDFYSNHYVLRLTFHVSPNLGGTAWKIESLAPNWAGDFYFLPEGRFQMAKRKRKPGEREGFKLNLSKDYRSERYVMYIANTETGLLQAGTVNPDLTDGDVNQALEDLMARLKQPEAAQLLGGEPQNSEAKLEGEHAFVQHFVLMNLRSAFERYGPLDVEDVIGILGVIKGSVKKWSVGMHRRGYLTFIEGFLGQMGVRVQQLTAAEADALGLKADDTIHLEKGE
jgi:hypothetical protein